MRKLIATATFAVAGAGALGAGAIAINGSDTLFDLTNDMVSNTAGKHNGGTAFCSPAFPQALNVVYNGGGSGLGESQMIKGLQGLAPMSRFLQSGICTSDAGYTTPDGAIIPVVADAAVGPSNANGIVIALDGLSIVSSQTQGGSVACNGAIGATSCTADNLGLTYNNAVAAITAAQRNAVPNTLCAGACTDYIFNANGSAGGWKDVLKVLYMGYVDGNFGHSTDVECTAGTGANACTTARGQLCNSSIRNALANTYSAVFDTVSCATGFCATGQAGTNGTIKGVWHIFRRDDASGTTDIFSQLLGFGGPSATANPVATNLGGYGLGTDNFCNDLANQPGVLPWKGGNNPNIIPRDHQDYDPIRRPCQGRGTNITLNNRTEQVCNRGTFDAPGTAALPGGACTAAPNNCPVDPAGVQELCQGGQCWGTPSLGLLLAMVDTTRLANESTTFNSQYDLVPAAPGAVPSIVNRCNGTQSVSWLHVPRTNGAGNTSGLCPNGDPSAAFAGVCVVPADANGNPNCISFKADLPPQLVSCSTQGENTGAGGYSACSGFGPNPGAIDTRVYNEYAYVFSAATGLWTIDTDDSGRPITGAFYRIHESQALLSPNTPSVIASPPAPIATPQAICTYQSMTDQIGCLVQADPCAFGYAGREADTIVGPSISGTTMVLAATATGMKLKGIPDAVGCVQLAGAPGSYPFWRKLYLDSIVGFGNVSLAEQGMAQCESTNANITLGINADSFITLPAAAPGGAGNPFCEDFNEAMLCSGNTANGNNNGCLANAAPIPNSGTLCGNGVVEFGEECDLGTPQLTGCVAPNCNGALPATCSTSCRSQP
jgi:hypothetical protein